MEEKEKNFLQMFFSLSPNAFAQLQEIRFHLEGASACDAISGFEFHRFGKLSLTKTIHSNFKNIFISSTNF